MYSLGSSRLNHMQTRNSRGIYFAKLMYMYSMWTAIHEKWEPIFWHLYVYTYVRAVQSSIF